MVYKQWPFSKPGGYPVGLSSRVLSNEYSLIERKSLLSANGHRFLFSINQSVDLLVSVSSTLASQRNWFRAGYFAAILTGGPITTPVQDVSRLYFGQQHLSITYTGLDFYLEFWPHTWISDYKIEVWGKEVIPIVLINQEPTGENDLLLFDVGPGSPTEQFTFFGDLITFP